MQYSYALCIVFKVRTEVPFLCFCTVHCDKIKQYINQRNALRSQSISLYFTHEVVIYFT